MSAMCFYEKSKVAQAFKFTGSFTLDFLRDDEMVRRTAAYEPGVVEIVKRDTEKRLVSIGLNQWCVRHADGSLSAMSETEFRRDFGAAHPTEPQAAGANQ